MKYEQDREERDEKEAPAEPAESPRGHTPAEKAVRSTIIKLKQDSSQSAAE